MCVCVLDARIHFCFSNRLSLYPIYNKNNNKNIRTNHYLFFFFCKKYLCVYVLKLFVYLMIAMIRAFEIVLKFFVFFFS